MNFFQLIDYHQIPDLSSIPDFATYMDMSLNVVCDLLSLYRPYTHLPSDFAFFYILLLYFVIVFIVTLVF